MKTPSKKRTSRAATNVRVTQKDLSEAFGVDVRTIRRWTRDGMPRASDGGYDLAGCIAWRRGQDLVEAEEKVLPPDLKAIRLAFEQARAEKTITEAMEAALDLADRRGQLMTVDTFREGLRDAYGRVAAQLRTLPHRLAPRIGAATDARSALVILKAAVRELMTDLHDCEDIPPEVTRSE